MNAGHKSNIRYWRILIVAIGLGICGTIGAVAAAIGAYYYVEPALPEAETIRDIPLQIPLRIFSRDGLLIEEIGSSRRVLITIDEVPDHVVNAFIAAEDRRFWVHPGIDYRGILRALFQLVTTGDVEAGGSTLTQQLARSYFLNLDQTIDRKFKEISLAVRIEQEFTKQQIMELFLNKMFFGQRAYGVSAAGTVFFNKDLKDLSIAEAATLAGVLPAPSRYNPVRSAQNAERRRGYVLGRMNDLDFISDEEYEEAMATPMESRLYGTDKELEADYVAEMVRAEMLKRFGEATYTAGYQVVTSLDSRLQAAATYALRNGLLEFTRRRGYKGPITNFELTPEILAADFTEWPAEILQTLDRYAPGGLANAIVTQVNDNNSADIIFKNGEAGNLPWSGISWAKTHIDGESTGPAPETAADVLASGDVIHVMPTDAGFWALIQVPKAQGAVVSVDPQDAAITSLAGGFDFATSKFNRVTQAARQPGSSFKPFIYSAALEHGNTLATVILDAPVVINSSELEAVWRPLNYSGRFYGPTRMREALVRSMNLVSVRLLLFNTGVGNAVEHIAKFGFGPAALPRNGSLALGGGAASPLDMVQGYATIANGGFAVKPYVIDAIFGPEGEVLYRSEPLLVCRECVAEPEDDFTAVMYENMTLEEMADVALTYQPDASIAPGLFANVNAAPRTVSEQNVYLIQDAMRDVIKRGTGRRATVLGRNDLSGKTGTSNDRRDAWFGGFQSDMAAIVWVGYDDDLPLGPGEEGSRTALPIWINFARQALEGVPNNAMPMPDGIVTRLISSSDGCPSRVGRPGTIFEMFREGHVPECEASVEPQDIFNDTTGIGDLFGGDDPLDEEAATTEGEQPDEDAQTDEGEDEEEDESLF
jgi:penicillin-binding protein 1A